MGLFPCLSLHLRAGLSVSTSYYRVFEINKLCYSQVMPMFWRILLTLENLKRSHSLSIGIPELAHVYKFRTHGFSHFVLQVKPNQTHLISKATQNDGDWRNKFFYVRRDTILDDPLCCFSGLKGVGCCVTTRTFKVSVFQSCDSDFSLFLFPVLCFGKSVKHL
ncbi:hypothetical protein Hanom_Chr16g01469441 [Helianthus anomalus]